MPIAAKLPDHFDDISLIKGSSQKYLIEISINIQSKILPQFFCKFMLNAQVILKSIIGQGMDTSKNETIWYDISTNEKVQYSNGTVNSILLAY